MKRSFNMHSAIVGLGLVHIEANNRAKINWLYEPCGSLFQNAWHLTNN